MITDDKWIDLASTIYNIVDKANKMRDDITVIMLAHTQTSEDGFTCMLTNGRKLNKIVLESKLTTVVLAREKDGKYIFETKCHNNTVKTPMGTFDGVEEIDNDIMLVVNELADF